MFLDKKQVGSIPVGILCIALVHYPVKGRKGETIASAITNLDLHDIARAAKTYGVERFYVVTPLTDQQALAGKIVAHWKKGAGAAYNPDRCQALDLVRITAGINDAVADAEKHYGAKVKTVATSAAESTRGIEFSRFRAILETPEKQNIAYMLALGTAWGLTEDFIAGADYILAPINGKAGYNHLSVRSAAAIMLDRILGDRAV